MECVKIDDVENRQSNSIHLLLSVAKHYKDLLLLCPSTTNQNINNGKTINGETVAAAEKSLEEKKKKNGKGGTRSKSDGITDKDGEDDQDDGISKMKNLNPKQVQAIIKSGYDSLSIPAISPSHTAWPIYRESDPVEQSFLKRFVIVVLLADLAHFL